MEIPAPIDQPVSEEQYARIRQQAESQSKLPSSPESRRVILASGVSELGRQFYQMYESRFGRQTRPQSDE